MTDLRQQQLNGTVTSFLLQINSFTLYDKIGKSAKCHSHKGLNFGMTSLFIFKKTITLKRKTESVEHKEFLFYLL